MSLFTAEDFEELCISGAPELSARIANAKHDAECGFKATLDAIGAVKSDNAELRRQLAKRDAEIERLRAEVESLKEPAAFGWQCYQDRCENAYIEASVVKRVESDNARLREALEECVRELSHLLAVEPSRRFGKYEAARDRARTALEGK